MQYDSAKILLLNIFFPIQWSVSLSLIYPYFPSYKACEQRPPAQVHRTDRLMDMPPYGQPYGLTTGLGQRCALPTYPQASIAVDFGRPDGQP
jgi:hypothetical protein